MNLTPIVLYNNTSSASPAPFQQMLIIPANTSINSTYTNIRFRDGNYKLLTSWLESYTTSSATIWIVLPNGISSKSAMTIYMETGNLSDNFLDGVTVGEAPQLSGTYGQYDNGANVFIQYGGKSWSDFTFSNGTWDTTNGYLEQTDTLSSANSGAVAVIENTSYPNNGEYIIEQAFSYSVNADARIGIVAVLTPEAGGGPGYRFMGMNPGNGAGFLSFLNDGVAWVSSNSYQGTVGTPYFMSITNAGGIWSGQLRSGYSSTGSLLTSMAAVSYTVANLEGNTSGYVGISASYQGTSDNPIAVQWFRLRAYPPNGVMPYALFPQPKENLILADAVI